MKSSKRWLNLPVAAILLILGAAVFGANAAGQNDDGWQIVRADYGYKDQRMDVTNLLLDLLSRGGVNGRIAVNNQTMGGDPAQGKDKSLHIFARNGRNQEHEFDYREGGFVDASVFVVPRNDWDDRGRNDGRSDRGNDRDDWRGLSIIRGYYGVQGRMANVTELLRSNARGRGFTANVNNGSMGGDPAPGADKVLIVVYRFDGQETATAVREGNILSIP
ncbi:MAG: hypothetical protein WB559_09575 [Candidatus Acidiferrales bacterium]